MAPAADAGHSFPGGRGHSAAARARRSVRHRPALVECTAARVGREGAARIAAGAYPARARRDRRLEPQRRTAGGLAGMAARRWPGDDYRQACCRRPHPPARCRGRPLLWQQRVGHGVLLSLPGDWDASGNAALRDPQVPRALLLALQAPPSPRLGDARDQAPHRAALPAATPPLREPTPWLLLAIVLLFALERWMASSRRRRVAA